MNSSIKFIDTIIESITPGDQGIHLILTPNTIHDITCDGCGNVVRVATAQLVFDKLTDEGVLSGTL